MRLPDDVTTLEDVERWFVEITLVSLKGSKTAAAKQLGIDRRTLYRKLDAWGLSDKYRKSFSHPPSLSVVE